MKKLFLILVTALTLSSCDKDNDNPLTSNPVDQLPPTTQTGANKVGCLLDGKVFLPGNFPLTTNCFYQNINGDYYFFVRCQNYDQYNNLVSIDVSTNKLQISEGETIQLKEFVEGNASGGYLFNLEENFTTTTQTGELKITKLDFTKNIVSGTFWFDVKDSDGIIHQIREGRFDMQFTQ